MIGQSLFNIFIQPLVLLIEFIFTVMSRIFGNYGIAIVMVSVVVNLLIFPLYKRSDALQEKERDTQRDMEKWVKHIKKTFKGDERFMMLSTYYRQKGYQPINALRGSLSLLLQVPFFMAAYHYLSHADLQGASFLFLNNLGAADHLIKIGGISLNLMPILMTLINCISGVIYTKGFPAKDKIQLYVLAGLFLIVLYQSPSGLVLYWTMNNLFSLLKNVAMKIIGPMLKKKEVSEAPQKATVPFSSGYFVAASALLTALTGLCIPSSVVGASPAEFISLNAYRNPLIFVWVTFCVALGTFGVWSGIIYYVSSDKGKRIYSLIINLLAFIFLADYMIFGNRTGTVSPLLAYHEGLSLNKKAALINLFVIALVTAIVVFGKKYADKWKKLSLVVALSLFGLGLFTVFKAQHEIKEMDYIKTISEDGETTTVRPILTLSKTGKNVVVLMLDRAISDYVPYIMAEKPELKEQFSGFVYYPNTVSFGQYTVYASAAIFGGYEYTPSAINERAVVSVVDKQNEALKVMPVLFSEEGYDVTVCDPPLAGYKEVPDLSIYSDYPDIDTHITMGAFLSDDQKNVKRLQDSQERNFFVYSLMKCAPVITQKFIYDEGRYFEATKNNTQSPAFLESYTVLTNLSALTDIREDSKGAFVMLDNETTHEPCLLQMPDYVPSETVNNSAYEDDARFTLDGRVMDVSDSYKLQHYHINMAAYLQLGKWFDYLKENGVYDNTRIIIVSDHGRVLRQFDDLSVSGDLDIEGYHPAFMVKDFNASEYSTSLNFMTNADVPSIALAGIIDNPVNPFTGNAITDTAKTEGEIYITTADAFDQNPGNTLDVSSGKWYRIAGNNIFDKNNWIEVSK